MASPTQLLGQSPYRESGFVLQNFTSTGQYRPENEPELKLDSTVSKKASVLTLNKPMFYGFWGSIFNTVLDNEPAETYDLIQEWIDHAAMNLQAVIDKFVPDDLNPKPPKTGVKAFVTTTLTDSQAKLLLKNCEVAELQGSIRRFVCARGCSNAKQSVSEKYRFPVGKDGLVDEF